MSSRHLRWFAVTLASCCLILALPVTAFASTPSTIDPATGASVWNYQDLADVSAKYEGGYADFDNSGETTYAVNPHGGYDTTTNKCKVCHAVHRAEGAYYLLRADSQDDACDYCHIGGSAHSTTIVYDLNSAGRSTPNGHTIGASTLIPDSSVSQWTTEIEIATMGSDGHPLVETINVRAFDEQKNAMYRLTRHHGHAEADGGARRNYIAVGPLALRCMNCHQVHASSALTWQSISMASMNNTGRYTSSETSGYKLLKQAPSGTFVGGLDSYGQVPIGNISLVPETTLTANVNYDTVRAEGDAPTALDLVRDGTAREYNKPMWVAQDMDREGSAGRAERSDPAAVNNAALSVWCADCHNLNIGGVKLLTNPELGYKEHTERTHPAPYVGAFNGPGQCYSCHRSDLPRKNTGDPCSQCHYGTGNYRENRADPAGFEYVDSDFPHSGEDGDFKLLGSYSVDVEGLNPTSIDESVTVGPNNIDAVCLRCHWIGQAYHSDGGAATSAHDVPAEYEACVDCHAPGGDVTTLHANTPDGCDSCHASGNVTTDCAACHADKLSGHGYIAAQHTATPPAADIRIFYIGDHEPGVMDGSQPDRDGVVSSVSCSICHSMELGVVHDNNCWGCHPSPYDTLNRSWGGGCQEGGCHTTYHEDSAVAHFSVDTQCNDCHDAFWNVTAASCPNCHAGYNPADTTPPVTTSNVQATYTGAAVIDFSMTDSGKVGVGTTYYRLDGAPAQAGSTLTVTSGGAHTLEYWSVDQAGNEETPHKSANFTVIVDTTPPTTTSNAQAVYYNAASITLTAVDASSLGVKATYFQLDGGPVQTGTFVYVPQIASANTAHTLKFWSEDYSGNVEAQHTANFTIYGTGTIRLVWWDADINPLHAPTGDEWMQWTVRRGGPTGPIVSTGTSYAPWSGVNNITVAASPTTYWVSAYYQYWNGSFYDQEQTNFTNVLIDPPGTVVRLAY